MENKISPQELRHKETEHNDIQGAKTQQGKSCYPLSLIRRGCYGLGKVTSGGVRHIPEL